MGQNSRIQARPQSSGILHIMFGLLLLFVSNLLLPNPSFSDPLNLFSWKGQVVEKGTGIPIEGAVIVRSWDREWPTPAGTGSELSTIKEGVSGKDGKFSVSNRSLSISIPFFYQIVENSTIVFKPGYKVLALNKRTSVIDMEKIPPSYYVRHEEAEKAKTMNYEVDFYSTKHLREVIEKEERTVKSLPRYVPGVFYQGFTFEKDFLMLPSDIAIDEEGNVYVADLDVIHKFSKNGELIKKRMDNLRAEKDIEFDKRGNLYAYAFGEWLLKINLPDLDISYLSHERFPKKKGEGFSSMKHHFTVSAGDKLFFIKGLYGMGSESKTVFSYDLKGNLLCRFDAKANDIRPLETEIQFLDITSDNEDNILIVYSFYNPVWDTVRNRYQFRDGILKLDPQCNQLFDKKIDLDGQKARSITQTSDGRIILASEDNIYVYDKHLTLMFKESLSGKELGKVDIRRIQAEREGEHLYMVESRYRRILRYNLMTRELHKK